MNPEREVFSSKESPLIMRKAAALSLAFSLTFTAAGCTFDGDSEPRPTPSFETADPDAVAEAERIDALMDMRCEVIPESKIDEVEDLYAETWTPPLPLDMEIDPSDASRLRFEKHAAIADKLDLTIFDYRSEFNDLSKDVYSGASTISIETYLTKAEEFMSRYGVTVTFSGEADGKTDEDIVATIDHAPLTREAFIANENLDAKYVLHGLIEEFGELPVELVKTVGLKRIVFTDIISTKSGITNVAGFVEPDDLNNDTIYIDQFDGNGSTAIHEMAHLWDAQQCGPLGMQYDEQYSDLNPAPAEGKVLFYEAPGEYYSDNKAFQLANEQDLYTALQQAQTPEEKALIYAQIDAIDAKVVTVDDYGLTNLIEDKATLGAWLFGSLNRWVAEGEESPILQDKMLLLATRLYEQNPEAVEYLARISQSHETTNVLKDN